MKMVTHKKRILIVEDSAEIQMLMMKFLDQNGYEVEGVDNGISALDHLNKVETKPDVILLDLMMPEMDGYEFRSAQLSNQEIADIPTIIMTADRDVEVKARQLKATGYLKKPFKDLDTILEVVEAATNL
jgi:CheY-like chemotaxis protein